ncbi:MAG: hypothetical protein ACNA8H_03845 [Anaerolineales bacterium]
MRGGQISRTDFINFHAGESLGQTFTARYRGLSGIQLFLKPGEGSQGTLLFNVHPGSQDAQVIVSANLDVGDVQTPDYYRFLFEPQSSSYNQDYYFTIEFQGEGYLQVGTAAGSSYLDGALYHNHRPLDLQTNFLLVYDPVQTALGVIALIFTWIWYLLVSGFLFALPGWALLSTFWRGHKFIHWFEKLALSAGLSLAFYPIFFLWTNLIGLRLGYLYAWLPPSFAMLWLLWKVFTTIREKGFTFSQFNQFRFKITKPDWRSLSTHLPSLSLLIVLVMVFAVRFWVIRSLDVPMWGDSYQHTMIAQLLVDNRGLFSSWEPYAEMQSFTYHFGFHSLVAVFHWITRLPMHQATLWTGQILNGLAVFSLYPLANRLGGNRWAGVAAVLVAGLLVSFPMYYVNWGRYTQLAGQAILPVAIYFMWKAIELKPRNWGLISVSWISVAGLALTHYRVLIFLVIFIAPLFLFYIRRKNFVAIVSNTTIVGVGAGLLFLPWFLRVFQGYILAILGHQLTTSPGSVSEGTHLSYILSNLTTYLPTWVWILLPISIIWVLWKKKSTVSVIGVWWFLIFIAANPSLLGLPGEDAIGNFTVFIATYIPAGLILGAFIGWLLDEILVKNVSRRTEFLSLLTLVLLFFAGLWGTFQRISDFQPSHHSLATRADIRAFQWINENTPTDALFLVNNFVAYGGNAVVGSDGGWWVPLLAHRQTVLPPLNYGSERGPYANYHNWITQLGKDIEREGHLHPTLLAEYQQRGITHVFVGQQQGQVNNFNAVLDPDELLAHPSFYPIYNQDRVWIFEFNP